jgi:hypothetical protein
MTLLLERHPWTRPGYECSPCVLGGRVRALCLGWGTASHFPGNLTQLLDCWADINDAEVAERVDRWKAAETAGRDPAGSSPD